MARETHSRVALLAIKPQYAEQIMSRRKKVEFRKVGFGASVDTVVVYASSPVKKIVGWFTVSYVDEDDPSLLWSRHRSYGGITRDDFDEYYLERDRGIAIGVEAVVRLEEPLPLRTLGDIVPPQSFRYLSDEVFGVLERRSGVN